MEASGPLQQGAEYLSQSRASPWLAGTHCHAQSPLRWFILLRQTNKPTENSLLIHSCFSQASGPPHPVGPGTPALGSLPVLVSSAPFLEQQLPGCFPGPLAPCSRESPQELAPRPVWLSPPDCVSHSSLQLPTSSPL